MSKPTKSKWSKPPEGSLASSTDSDSSVDEEESSRIKAALCDDSLFQSFAKPKKETASIPLNHLRGILNYV